MSEHEIVERGEHEVRREPLPRWMRGCCAFYLGACVVAVLYAGYAVARSLL